MTEEHGTSARAVIAADREVLQQLRREVDELGELVRREQDAGRHLQGEVQESQDKGHNLAQEERQLTSALEEAKAKLRGLRVEHRGTNLESLSLGSDRGHVAEELSFLQHRAEDDRRSLDVLNQANQLLQRHNVELDTQLKTLEMDRKNLTYEGTQEKELAKREERELAELRNQAERLRRAKLASHHEEREAQSREQRLREIKGGVVSASPMGSPQRPMQSAGHSWAQHVSGVTSPSLGASPASSQKRGGPIGMRGPGADVHF